MYRLRSGYCVPQLEEYGSSYVGDVNKGGGKPGYDADYIREAIVRCKHRYTAVDVGAYIGSWALHLAEAFDHVHVFEPILDNFKCLQENLSDFRNVIFEQKALSDVAGTVMMNRYKDTRAYTWAMGNNGITEAVSAMAVKLDDLNFQTLDLLKVSVNGAEDRVIRGALQTLKRCKPVVFVNQNNDPHKRACRILEQLGMSCVIGKNQGVGSQFDKHKSRSDSRKFIFVWR
jgi:FkbM family methyltransferase